MKLVLLGKRVSLLEERVSSLENRVTLVMSVKVFEPLAMINSIFITPSPKGVGVMGWRPSPGLNPLRQGNVALNLLALEGTLAIHGGEEVGRDRVINNLHS
jgi:hypothetical protein